MEADEWMRKARKPGYTKILTFPQTCGVYTGIQPIEGYGECIMKFKSKTTEQETR